MNSHTKWTSGEQNRRLNYELDKHRPYQAAIVIFGDWLVLRWPFNSDDDVKVLCNDT